MSLIIAGTKSEADDLQHISRLTPLQRVARFNKLAVHFKSPTGSV